MFIWNADIRRLEVFVRIHCKESIIKCFLGEKEHSKNVGMISFTNTCEGHHFLVKLQAAAMLKCKRGYLSSNGMENQKRFKVT